MGARDWLVTLSKKEEVGPGQRQAGRGQLAVIGGQFDLNPEICKNADYGSRTRSKKRSVHGQSGSIRVDPGHLKSFVVIKF